MHIQTSNKDQQRSVRFMRIITSTAEWLHPFLQSKENTCLTCKILKTPLPLWISGVYIRLKVLLSKHKLKTLPGFLLVLCYPTL